MPSQEKLIDVPVSNAQREAEHYADMAAFVRQKTEEMKAQAELVIEKMDATGQRKLSFKDEYGVRHHFEVVETAERLKYSKQGEAAK